MAQDGQRRARSDKFERLSSGRSALSTGVRSDLSDHPSARAPPRTKSTGVNQKARDDSKMQSQVPVTPPARSSARSPGCDQLSSGRSAVVQSVVSTGSGIRNRSFLYKYCCPAGIISRCCFALDRGVVPQQLRAEARSERCIQTDASGTHS